MKKIIALGGGYMGAPREVYVTTKPDEIEEHFPTTSMDKLIIQSTGKKAPLILLITIASEDGKHNLDLYIEAFKKQYQSLGAQISILKLRHERPSRQIIESKIFNADAIYVSGGNSYLMMKKWRRLGIDKLLKKAYEKGTVMSGLSAGALCWFKYGNSNSFYTNIPFRVTALGWVNALLCPHYDSEPFRQDPFKKMIKRTQKMVGIALDEHAAIEIIENKYKVHSFESGGKVRKCYYLDSQYVIEEIKLSHEYSSLQSLLEIPK